jgi:hypothetical protein
MNGRMVDITIEIPQTSLAVRMYNPAKGSKPEQVLSDVDEGAGVGCSDADPEGSILRSLSSPMARPEGKLGAEREYHVESPMCHGLPGRILSVFPTWRASVDVVSSDTYSSIGRNTMMQDQS